MQTIEMMNDLQRCAATGKFEGVKQLVEGGANIEETDEVGRTALSLASLNGELEIVAFFVEHGANVAHTDDTDGRGRSALHYASCGRDIPTVKHLLEHGARITDSSAEGNTALLYATENRRLEMVQYLQSSEGGASITEIDKKGNTALLLAASDINIFQPLIVQWLLEYRDAQIPDTNHAGNSVWTESVDWQGNLRELLMSAYAKDDDGEYVFLHGEYTQTEDTVEATAMLRVMVLHGGPPDLLTADLAPPLQRIVQDGARLRARLPTYLTKRRALSDAYCQLLPPLKDLVHGYEEPTTPDELWATGLGAPLQCRRRSRPEGGQASERRSARLHQKHL
jgi:ankyrin repeat protein